MKNAIQQWMYAHKLFLIVLVLSFLQFGLTKEIYGATEQSSTEIEQKSEASKDPAREDPKDDFFDRFGIHHWDPYGEIQAMREQMDRIFNNFNNRLRMSPFSQKNRSLFDITPQTDLEEEADNYIVTMNIPGAKNAAIDVNLEGNTLTVTATTKRSYEEKKDRNYLRMERSMGSFQRVITLPGPVKVSGMVTKYEDGVLTVTIPKEKKRDSQTK